VHISHSCHTEAQRLLEESKLNTISPRAWMCESMSSGSNVHDGFEMMGCSGVSIPGKSPEPKCLILPSSPSMYPFSVNALPVKMRKVLEDKRVIHRLLF
jgi:hypothetical protein